jgi:small subunit ribosomal protein S1
MAPCASPVRSGDCGQEITAKILKFDTEKNRVSLGEATGRRSVDGRVPSLPQGTRLFGKVTNITDYGAFVNRTGHRRPGARFRNGLDQQERRSHQGCPWATKSKSWFWKSTKTRRISLGMKQCKANPWEDFAQNTKRGDRVKGPIKSITDFGVFVGLAAGIDGLVHLSDLSWNEAGEAAVRNYKKGTKSKPSCWPWTLSASASPWASSSWTAIPSRPS